MSVRIASCVTGGTERAATAISGIGAWSRETRRIREMVEATTAEARSIRGNVESRVATLAAAADVKCGTVLWKKY